MELKQYQQDALGSVGDYFSACLDNSAEDAFKVAQPNFLYKTPSKGLHNVPYVCVRIPTGGGRQPDLYIAAHPP